MLIGEINEKKIVSFIFISMIFLTNISLVNASIKSNENIEYEENFDSDEVFENKCEYNKLGYKPGEIIIKFKEKISFLNDDPSTPRTGLESIDALNEKYKVTSSTELFKKTTNPLFSNIHLLNFSERFDPVVVAKQYQDNPDVELAEPNIYYKYFTSPNDPRFSNQWSLNQENDCDIDATEAWDIVTGSSDVVVAIVDTGIDKTHPDLLTRIFDNFPLLKKLLN